MSSPNARIVVAEPAEPLKDLVDTFWQVESDGPTTLRCLPTGRLDLVYVLDGEVGCGPDRPPVASGRVVLTGGFEHAALLSLSAGCRLFGLRFQLGSPGARLLAGPRPSAGAWIDLTATSPETWNRFDFRPDLDAQADFAARVAVVESALMAQAIPAATLAPLDTGPADLGKAQRLRWMRRMRQLAKTATGLTPKKLQMLDRFGTAKRLIEEDEMQLSEIALAAGYYDQAHLNREFIRMSGVPPLKHRSRRNVGFFSLDHVAGPDLAGTA